jgi:uncharacterized repeat protein (TIGR01451 family)
MNSLPRLPVRLLSAIAMLCIASLSDAAVTLKIQMNPDTVRAAETLRTQLTVSNTGGGSVSGVVLTATYPANVVNLSKNFMSDDGNCPTFNPTCTAGAPVVWNLGTLPAGGSITVSMPARLTSSVANGTVITVNANVAFTGGSTVNATDSVTVDNVGPFSLGVTDDIDTVLPGGQVTYTLTYGNRGAGSATATTLAFPLPAGTTLVSSTGGTFSAGVVSWSLGGLAAGASGTQRVVVSVAGGLAAGTTLRVDPASITGTVAGLVKTANAEAVTQVISAAPALGLAIVENPDPVRPGEVMRGSLTVSNQSGGALSGVTLRMRLSDETDNVSQSFLSDGGTCPLLAPTCTRVAFADWNLGALAAGASVTVSIPLRVSAGIANGQLITMDAVASEGGGGRTSSTRVVAVDSASALSLAVTDDFDAVQPGQVVTYTLTYGNRSGASATATTLAFPLPAGTTLVSSTGGTLSAGVVSWNLGALPAGISAKQQVVVSVNNSVAGGSQLRIDPATLSGTVGGLTKSARAEAVTQVISAAPALGLAIVENPDPVRPGEVMRGSLTVSNQSGGALSGVTLRMRLSDETDNVSQSFLSDGGTCPLLAPTCTRVAFADWNLGALAAGASITVSIPLRVSAGIANGQLITMDAVASEGGGGRTSSTRVVAVDSASALSLAVTDDFDAVQPGQVVTYTLTYGNRSGASATATTLAFPLPAGTTLVSSTGGTLSAGVVTWNLGTLTAGQGGRRMVRANVGGAVPAGSILSVDTARMQATVSGVPVESRARGATRVKASTPLRLKISGVANPTQPGQTLTTTITVTNAGGSPLNGIALNARIPDEINNFSQTLLNPSGTCPLLTPTCTRVAFANWNLATPLAAGASTSFTMPPVVSAGIANGQLITLEAAVRDGSGQEQATATDEVLVNPFTDTDGDGAAQVFDNCTSVANADQRDTDGDGFGNRCDGDFDETGLVSFPDLAIFKSRFGTTNADADLDGNGSVNFTDLAIFKGLFGKAPGPSALAP